MEGQLLIGSRALPDRHGEHGGLEIEEAGREPEWCEIGGGSGGIEVGFAGDRALLDPVLEPAKQFVGNVAQVVVACGFDPHAPAGVKPGQRTEREIRTDFALVAIIGEAAGEGRSAVGAGGHLGLCWESRHCLCAGNPFPHLRAAGVRFFGQVAFLEEAAVVAIALIDERVVDVRQ